MTTIPPPENALFEIPDFIEAHLASVTTRTEKHGDDDVPAVSLSVEITTANTLLDAIDPQIRHALYKAVDGQDELPGVEPATPVLRCNSFDIVSLTTTHEGWRLMVEDGIDDSAPMEFTGVKVDKLRVDAKQGGSVVLKVRLGTSDVDAERLGKLGMHNGQSIWIKVLKPDKAPDVIDGTLGHPGAAAAGDSATDLFAQQHGVPDDGTPPDDADDEGAAPDGEHSGVAQPANSSCPWSRTRLAVARLDAGVD